jgi:hypothetical protein
MLEAKILKTLTRKLHLQLVGKMIHSKLAPCEVLELCDLIFVKC